ncbi:PIF1-like helicase-domain-containing protein [Lactarius pseudohatsudake]|nr:PIF1-like helicase-domain-containing protein [Lactarius pseudohatsudake]
MAEKYYFAVKKGREGPKIYDSWEECQMAVTGYSRVEVKKFKSLAAAEAWILPVLMSLCPPAEQPTQPAEPGPLNTAISCGENILSVDPIEDRATRPPEIVLSEEQAHILNKVKKGGNVFFTGPAGTGKTVLLHEIIKCLRLRFPGPGRQTAVAVTASTGIASISIGGTTLHSWAGIGLGEGTAERLSGKILGTDYLRERWQGVENLIIDESKMFFLRVDPMLSEVVSMISGVLFDKLEEIARTVRDYQRPFGGIQVKFKPP